jgi:hypothetical protein
MIRIPAMKAGLLAAITLLASGCASTSLVGDWQNPNYRGSPLTKILVIGIHDEGDKRRVFEDQFVAHLRAHGVDAVASYTLIPRDGQVPEEEIAKAVQASGANGVLITRVVRVDKETAVTTGYSQYTAFPAFGYGGPPPYYNNYYGFYSTAWATYYPPTVQQFDVVTLETNLWAVNGKEVLWSGTTEVTDPRNLYKATDEIINVITDALAKRKLIPE